MRAVAALGFAAVAFATALPAAAIEWQALRRDANAVLAIDPQSVKREGDEVSFQFLIDLREAQGDLREGPPHRSIVTQARLRCKARTIALGEAEVFVQNGAQGPATGRSAPAAGGPQHHALEKASSDEDLWDYFCGKGAAEPKKK